VQRRWWLVEEEEEAAAVRCYDETMPWNVGGVRDGGAELRWSSEKGGAVRWWLVEEEEAAALERRDGGAEPRWSVGGAPEVRRTMGPVREGGAGRRRTEGWPEKTNSQNTGEDEIAEQRRIWGFLTLRRDTASVIRNRGIFYTYCLGYYRTEAYITLTASVITEPRHIPSVKKNKKFKLGVNAVVKFF